MSQDNLSHALADVKLNEDTNILLLGETGVGKSTFINAMANYLSFKDFKSAEKEKIINLIPSSFTVVDKNFQHQRVKVGADDQNEQITPGASATQDVKTYVFPLYESKEKVRLIDTPGLADTRGIEQDELNCENILSYLTNLHHLHAICILLKPTNTRLTVGFEYCIKKILSHLDKSAAKNIIFCFTNTRGSNYSAGETHTCIEEVIKSVKNAPPHVEIPFDKNKFFFDNEAYRYLAAVQNGVDLDNSIKVAAIESWKKSYDQCKKLFIYIHGDKNTKPLDPHKVKTTISINETRRLINQLSQPLLDISQNIDQNIRVLERHRKRLEAEGQTLDDLKANLYMPVIKLKDVKLSQPVTVCASAKCVEVVKIEGDIQRTNYTTKCHDPCYLTNVQKEIVGDRNLLKCWAMNGSQNCRQCGCTFLTHMHIYYMTEKFADREVDKNIERNIGTKEDAMAQSRKYIEKFEKRITELKEEHDQVVEAAARFANFLQNNAITPFNDSYAGYIEHLITREKSYGPDADQGTIFHLTQLKRRYDELKLTFEEALKKGGDSDFSLKDIQKVIQNLYKLKHMGTLISSLVQAQKTARKMEHKNTEYIHKYQKKEEAKKQTKAQTKPQEKGADKKKMGKNKQNKMSAPPAYDQVFKNKNQNPQHAATPPPPTQPYYFPSPPPPATPSQPPPIYGGPSYHQTPERQPPSSYLPPKPVATEIKVLVNETRQPGYDQYYRDRRSPPSQRSYAYEYSRHEPDGYGSYRRPEDQYYRPRPEDQYYRPRPEDQYYRPRPEDPYYPPGPQDHQYPPRPQDHQYPPRPQNPYYPPRPQDQQYPPHPEGNYYPPRPEARFASPPQQPGHFPPNQPPHYGGATPPTSLNKKKDYAKYSNKGGVQTNTNEYEAKNRNNNSRGRGQRGRGRGNFKRNVNRKGKGNNTSDDSDDADN